MTHDSADGLWRRRQNRKAFLIQVAGLNKAAIVFHGVALYLLVHRHEHKFDSRTYF
jgi:hypothetical protein